MIRGTCLDRNKLKQCYAMCQRLTSVHHSCESIDRFEGIYCSKLMNTLNLDSFALNNLRMLMLSLILIRDRGFRFLKYFQQSL